MFKAAPAQPITFERVQTTEGETILGRRRNLNIKNDVDFSELDQGLDIPAAQRSEALNVLLKNLNDPQQSDCWQAHAQRNPSRQGIGNFTGLALSGGGIRSATFNLGALQVLGWARVLRHVDYLSSVSGGGYIGSCISSMLASPLREFPFEHKQGQKEGAIFRHLRNNAEYLAPSGVVDYLRIPMTTIRGMVINLLVIMPYLLIAALVTALLHPTFAATGQHWLRSHWSALPQFLGNQFVVSKCLLMLIGASFVLYPVAYMFFQRVSIGRLSDWSVRNYIGWFYGALLLVVAVVAFIEFQPVAISWLIFQHQNNAWAPMMSGGFTALQAAIPAAISAWLLKNAGKLAAKYVLTLLGLSALLTFWSLYLWLSVVLIEGQYATSLHTLYAPLASVLVLLTYGIFFVDMNHTSVHSFYRDRLSKAYIVKQVVTEQTTQIQPNDRQLLSELNIQCGPYHLINAAINLRCAKESYRRGRHADSFIFSPHYIGSGPTGYCTTKVMESQSQHLNLATAMAISGAAAAPNMGKETNRLFAFFLAMLNVRLNYWLPNPRYAVMRRNSYLPRNPLHRVGPLYLLRELFGRLNESSNNVNLSDGGHFDNTGLYELLRRECRFIICGDGEEDKHLRFDGLANVLRMAQIDFGILIEMQGLDQLRAGEQSYAIGRIRYSDGRIGWLLYLKQSLPGDDSLRASLDETAYWSNKRRDDCSRYDAGVFIAEYKGANPDFPHQTTNDQFFDETQFECTRAVGYNVAYHTLCR